MLTQPAPINVVFQTHYVDLVQWCRPLVPRDLAEPEDIVHSAYLRVQDRFELKLVSTQWPLAFLKRAIRWELADRRRMESQRQRREKNYWEQRRGVNKTAPPAIVSVNECLENLRGRMRQVCQALLEGKSRPQLCEELHITAGALAVCLCRTRKTLFRLLRVDDENHPVKSIRPSPLGTASFASG
jgi:hypothetical protein